MRTYTSRIDAIVARWVDWLDSAPDYTLPRPRYQRRRLLDAIHNASERAQWPDRGPGVSYISHSSDLSLPRIMVDLDGCSNVA